MTKKLIGVMRYYHLPYGVWAKKKVRTITTNLIGKDGKKFTKACEELDLDNENVVYTKSPKEILDSINYNENEVPAHNASATQNKVQKRSVWLPFKEQPLHYIYEENIVVRGKPVVLVEVRFCKTVPYYEWKKYPVYDTTGKVVYWIH